ncbi:hypothetical protein ABVK25_012500 [Lepraria finkii]|uniref:Uncharacterized protein n=1 Tax=Lepraria finkii TaxID=1340010 RepID=A0ABR4AG04_9LECA
MTVAIKEVIVSANIVNEAGKELLTYASLTAHGQRSAETEILAFQVDGESELIPAASIHCGELRATGYVGNTTQMYSGNKLMTYRMEWDSDIDYLDSNRLKILAPSLILEATGVTPEFKNELLDQATL